MQQKDQIERIIESGKNIHPAEPNPYLFKKVLLKLKDRAEQTYQTRPALVWVSMSVLTLFIAINIYVLTTGSSQEAKADMNNVASYYGITNQGGLSYE